VFANRTAKKNGPQPRLVHKKNEPKLANRRAGKMVGVHTKCNDIEKAKASVSNDLGNCAVRKTHKLASCHVTRRLYFSSKQTKNSADILS